VWTPVHIIIEELHLFNVEGEHITITTTKYMPQREICWGVGFGSRKRTTDSIRDGNLAHHDTDTDTQNDHRKPVYNRYEESGRGEEQRCGRWDRHASREQMSVATQAHLP
jgi:hypothetical protein